MNTPTTLSHPLTPQPLFQVQTNATLTNFTTNNTTSTRATFSYVPCSNQFQISPISTTVTAEVQSKRQGDTINGRLDMRRFERSPEENRLC